MRNEFSGVVSERDSGQPIGACTVSVGEQYTHTDPTGRYDLRTGWQRQTAIKFVAAGYAVQTKALLRAQEQVARCAALPDGTPTRSWPRLQPLGDVRRLRSEVPLVDDAVLADHERHNAG